MRRFGERERPGAGSGRAGGAAGRRSNDGRGRREGPSRDHDGRGWREGERKSGPAARRAASRLQAERKAGRGRETVPPPAPAPDSMRINAYLARCLNRARRECDVLVERGSVTLNGRKALFNDRVRPGDTVMMDGTRLEPAPKTYVALNKPAGLVTAVRDARERTVMSILPPRYQSLFPVGRLDRDSRGLLLLTNDGDWADRILHPRHGVPRVYRVVLDRAVDIEAVRRGVRLHDGYSKFDAVEAEGKDGTVVKVILTEGRKRQIRRTFKELRYRVLDLARTRIGRIELGDLPEGAARPLTREEVEGAWR